MLLNLKSGLPENRVVVRLKTRFWSDSKGIYKSQSLTYLKRRCIGHNFIQEEVDCVDADSTIDLIKNLEDCPDGVYSVEFCDVAHDSMGEVIHYQYKLTPAFDDGIIDDASQLFGTDSTHIHSIAKCGKYWAFRCGNWFKAVVSELPSRGGTGTLSYSRGIPITGNVAIADCQALFGPVKSWGKVAPKITNDELLAKGVNKFWLK